MNTVSLSDKQIDNDEKTFTYYFSFGIAIILYML